MNDKNVTLVIDGLSVTVPESTTILEAARKVNVKIPTLCDHPDLCKRALCRLCVVENDGRGKLLAACAHNAEEGMNIVTNNSRIFGIRKTIVGLILSSHPHDECLACMRNTKCELQSLAGIYSTSESPFQKIFPDRNSQSSKEISCNALVRDMDKCVKCGRCVEACQEIQAIRAINTSGRSADYAICTPYAQALSESPCVFCGHCAEVCPVGAIYEYDQSAEAWALLNEKKRGIVIEIAPQETQAVCEELGFPTGAITIGKIITGLKRIGFSGVYNAMSFAAISANEEAAELTERIKSSRLLPMISGCSDGCTKFVKEFYPDLLNHLSKAKIPEQNFRDFIGGAKKTFVSIVPCVAKKYKAPLPYENNTQEEIVLTARELAKVIRLSGIDLSAVEESAFDPITGETSGFETNSKSLEINGFANARKVLDSIRAGKCGADRIKIFSCPSGCKTGV